MELPVKRAAFLPSNQPAASAAHRKKRMKKFTAILALLVLPLALTYAQSTANVISKADGLHITTKATDKWSVHNAATSAQQPATVTAYGALVTKGVIAPGGLDYSVQHKTVSLTAANIIAMYTTPVALIAAPGAGKSIVVAKVAFTITRTATAFTGGGAAIIQYAATANGGGTQALDSTLAAAVITGAAGTTVSFRNGAVISDAASTVTQNAGLYISNATAVFAAGTGTATVDIWYYVY